MSLGIIGYICEKPDALAERELKDLISKSYQLVFDKLPPKIRKTLAN